MNRPVLILLIVVVIAVVALIGCGCCAAMGGVLIWGTVSISGGEVAEVATATARPRPTSTARVIPTPRPTSTPRPTLTPRPTSTPRPTATPRPTDTPRPTPKPSPTVAPMPVASHVYMEDDGKGHRRCNPDTVKAGRIVIERGLGRWPTKEAAYAALGDSWPPIVANGRELPTKHVERSEVQWHSNGPDDPSPGWGFHAKVEIRLDPGVYEITSLWLHDLKTGTLTVVAP